MTLTNALDPNASQHSKQLLSLIKDKIAEAGGKISFADYMHLCLYAPGLGYYSAGSQKLGQQGDFTTAPEISSLFSRTLAHQISDVFQQMSSPNILEFGAGSGKMAADILTELDVLNHLPEHYYIIEASADLQQRQYEYITKIIPHLANKVSWLNTLPLSFEGVLLANEVCDAMPVHSLHFKQGQAFERFVTIDDKQQRLQWCLSDISAQPLMDYAKLIASCINNDEFITEVNLAAEAWVATLADSLKLGTIFIIDYGYSHRDYYHPQRNMGTLMCYFQHQGHDNPLILQGLQDITAHVNFTSLAQAALDHGLDVAGFQSQADFLIAGGITDLALNYESGSLNNFQIANEIKRLTLPSEMGEAFKVLTLTKNLDRLLTKVQRGDRRYCL